KSYFWQAFIAARLAKQDLADKLAPQAAAKLQRQSADADQHMQTAWNQLTQDQQQALLSSYNSHWQATLSEDNQLQSPAKILLSSLTSALDKPMAAPAPTPREGEQVFSPS